MFKISSMDDFNLLRESSSFEFKLAGGRDGKGELPNDFWPTYSAMANTDGGTVVLGVRERKGQFELVGIEHIEKVKAELFNNLNNQQKISANLLNNQNVYEQELQGKTLLIIDIPRAPRRLRPVHVSSNPFNGNSYCRLNEGDFSFNDEQVKRLLAEQVNDSLDTRILTGFSFQDLDAETFRAYRQIFSNREHTHPWNDKDDLEFLRLIGGWRKDREIGEEGLTLAGLLMFGQMTAIQEALPNYMLDYQERPEDTRQQRWLDRITLDGMWSGNVFDYYRKVYLKLTADLKIPFHLEKGERIDETPVHDALREALANALVHADYSDRASILVIKQADSFRFRNPGLMRVPPTVAIQGGEPDCRNRTLHKMFRFAGIGEQAGSGIPTIFQGWKSQHWSPPNLYELREPYDQTVLELRMVDLFPSDVMEDLHSHFASKFEALNSDMRLILALASIEETVSHARLVTALATHPVEITRMLQQLCQAKMLIAEGSGKGTVYFLPWQKLPTAEQVFGPNLRSSSVGLAGSSSVLSGSSSVLEQERDEQGYLQSEQLPLPVIDELAALSSELRQHLETLAFEPRNKKKMNREAFQKVVLDVCAGHYLTLQALAELLNRQPASLRNGYLTPMVRDKELTLAFPTTPTHERQAYCLAESLQGLEHSDEL